MELTDKDVEILNTKVGLKKLIANNVVDLEKSLNGTKYELELRSLQEQLIALQERVIKNHEKVVVIFEGRDSAGKIPIVLGGRLPAVRQGLMAGN